jgi:hypothetical protein
MSVITCVDVYLCVRGQDCMPRRVCAYISACVDMYMCVCEHNHTPRRARAYVNAITCVNMYVHSFVHAETYMCIGEGA